MARKTSFSRFYSLRLQAGLGNVNQAAEWCGVTPQTIRTWDKKGAPLLAERLLSFKRGDLGALHSDWHGFKIQGNQLIGPGKIAVRPEELTWFPVTRTAFEATKLELANLKHTPWFRLHRICRFSKSEFFGR